MKTIKKNGDNIMGERVLVSFDFALKRLLRKKSDYEVLEGFLSEVLSKNISVKNIGESESNKEHNNDKFNKVDILVESASGEIMLVELQFRSKMDYLQRMLYGTSKTITEHMFRGAEYVNVKKVYSINVVYFDLGQGDDYVYHGKTHFVGLHKKDELHLTEAQRDTFGGELPGDIYPEYYILKVNNFGGEAKDTLDEWIYFLKTNTIKDNFHAKGMNKARKLLIRENLTIKDRKEYDRLVDARSDELSIIATAEDTGRRKGKKEGIEKGKKEREKLKQEREKLKQDREKLKQKLDESGKREKKLEQERKALLAEITKLKQNKQK
jgi:predicted transposase/invertase (TIGR01784 family)